MDILYTLQLIIKLFSVLKLFMSPQYVSAHPMSSSVCSQLRTKYCFALVAKIKKYFIFFSLSMMCSSSCSSKVIPLPLCHEKVTTHRYIASWCIHPPPLTFSFTVSPKKKPTFTAPLCRI